MDIKQDVVTIPHAIQYITSVLPLISMASIRQIYIFLCHLCEYVLYTVYVVKEVASFREARALGQLMGVAPNRMRPRALQTRKEICS